LPQEKKEEGPASFTAQPPEDNSDLVTRLWDKHFPKWRERGPLPKEVLQDKRLQSRLENIVKESEREPGKSSAASQYNDAVETPDHRQEPP